MSTVANILWNVVVGLRRELSAQLREESSLPEGYLNRPSDNTSPSYAGSSQEGALCLPLQLQLLEYRGCCQSSGMSDREWLHDPCRPKKVVSEAFWDLVEG
uniref:Uncharacterized protein n=1 Tax=Oryza brachyantha TaxID=4533 RepID=J3MBY5_ORYBR